MIMGSIYQEDMTTLYIYALDNIASIYVKQTPI